METGIKDYLFMGRFPHSLDPKKRLTVPSAWREELAPETQVSIIPGFDRRCLLVLPGADARRRIREAIQSRSLTDRFSSRAASLVGEMGCYTTWDSQGRIRIPDQLLEWAGLSNDVVMVGALAKIELWSPENLAADRASEDAPSMEEAARETGL